MRQMDELKANTCDRQKNIVDMMGVFKKIGTGTYKTTNCYLYRFHGRSQ